VRVGVRAAGMNFRDVLVALGEIGSPGIGLRLHAGRQTIDPHYQMSGINR
jgi:hypothetical protein